MSTNNNLFGCVGVVAASLILHLSLSSFGVSGRATSGARVMNPDVCYSFTWVWGAVAAFTLVAVLSVAARSPRRR